MDVREGRRSEFGIGGGMLSSNGDIGFGCVNSGGVRSKTCEALWYYTLLSGGEQ